MDRDIFFAFKVWDYFTECFNFRKSLNFRISTLSLIFSDDLLVCF